jgi:hypothetical protein
MAPDRDPQPTVPETPRDVLGFADDLAVQQGRIVAIEEGLRRFYVGLNPAGERITINRYRVVGADIELKVTDAAGNLLAHGTMSREARGFKPLHVADSLGSTLVTLEPDNKEMDRLVDVSPIVRSRSPRRRGDSV